MIKYGTYHQAYIINGTELVEMNGISVDPKTMTADKHFMSKNDISDIKRVPLLNVMGSSSQCREK
jgi:hypothetical protein